jgi:quercetin dioxygenase-like cupin family protein
MQKKSFNTPDETRTPPKTKVEVVKIGNQTLMRTTFEPGWKWSEHIKPTVGTDSCQVHHLIYSISGQMKVVMNDGTEAEVAPGDIADIPPGHDAWVVGDEPAVGIDFAGGVTYAKPSE